MGAFLVGEVASRFELERAVLDVEVPGHAGLDLVEDLGCMTVREARVVHDDMGGQGREVGSDGPGVEVVDVDDAGSDFVEVDAFGGGLEQYPPGRFEQTCRRSEHEGDDDERGNGVGPLEPGGQQDDAGDEGGNEPVEVGDDVLEGAFDVQAGPVGFGQHPGGHDVVTLEGDLDALPLADDSVDVAVANMVLHHAPDPAMMLTEMAPGSPPRRQDRHHRRRRTQLRVDARRAGRHLARLFAKPGRGLLHHGQVDRGGVGAPIADRLRLRLTGHAMMRGLQDLGRGHRQHRHLHRLTGTLISRAIRFSAPDISATST